MNVYVINSSFLQNTGGFSAYGCNVTFSGYTRVSYTCNSMETLYDTVRVKYYDEGVITSYYSNIMFTGESHLSNNRAGKGGAILVTESTVTINGKMTINNNIAYNNNSGFGGCIYLEHI